MGGKGEEKCKMVKKTFTLRGKIKLWILKHVLKINVLELIFSDKQKR